MSNQDGNQPYTPYAPPTANVVSIDSCLQGTFIPGGRPGGNAIGWVSNAWDLFKRQPGTWILFILICFGIGVFLSLLSLIPFVGLIVQIASMFVSSLFIAGVVYSCDRLQREGLFTLDDLFAAFNRQTRPLLMFCLLVLGFMIVMGVIVGILFAVFLYIGGGIAFFSSLSLEQLNIIGIATIIIVPLLTLVGCVLCGMAVWFSPALIMMHNIPPFEAMKMSLSACSKNILPGIIFFIMLFIMGLGCLFTLGLATLVIAPMIQICYYTSYRDVFFDEENLSAVRRP
ncbi:MAG: TMEM43 family protein [Betaproteobacteria bacterium]|nr:TMEM43 family protein [Betaproteobacteria bacterium]